MTKTATSKMPSATTTRPPGEGTKSAAPHITAGHISWAVIGFGVLLRAAEYLANPALYIDEGALALNVINRSFAGLFRPLDSNQAAPLGFLLLEKLAVLAVGNNEYALRLFPFLFSIAALFLFRAVARRILVAWGVPVALLFFAASNQVVYYSAQAKQYSSDVAIALSIVFAGLAADLRELTPIRAFGFALLGALAVWISHPSVFVLGGVGLTIGLAALGRKERAKMWKLIACYAVWLASFAVFYSISLANLGGNQRLEASWMKKGTFMPLPPASLLDLSWFPDTFIRVFTNPVASPFPLAAGLLFILGCVALLRKNKTHLSMMISPIALALLASGLHKYPFGRRLLLFLLPLVLLLMVSGIESIVARSRPWNAAAAFVIVEAAIFQLAAGGLLLPSINRWLLFAAASAVLIIAAAVVRRARQQGAYATLLGCIILVFLLLQPVGGAANNMLNPPAREDIRPVLAYIRDHRTPGDVIYAYYHVKESFEYYARRYGFAPDEYVLGVDQRAYWVNSENEAYDRDLAQLRPMGRVWFVFSYVRTINGVNEEHYFTRYLDRFGKRLDSVSQSGASAYLYDLHD